MLLHYFEALPCGLKSTIPRSTLSSWKSKNLSSIIGCDSFLDEYATTAERMFKNEKLIRTCKALYTVFDTISVLFNNALNKAELLQLNKSLVLQTIQKVKPVLGVKRVLNKLGLSASKMYYWLEKKNCSDSIFQLCPIRHPNQLLTSEVSVIKNYLSNENFNNWSVLSIYYQAMRDKAASMSIGTWYKYANRLGVKRNFFNRPKTHKIGITATRPLEKLHMDITLFRTVDNTRVYIYFIVDNYSRAILNWKASTSYSSNLAMNLLKGAIHAHSINTQAILITDDGSENKGDVSTFIKSKENLTQLIAQKDIIQSNSMVEAVNKHIKYYYLFKNNLKNLDELQKCLASSVPNYNNKPHGRIYGFTPNEVLDGAIPTTDVYSIQKLEARKLRNEQNKLILCCKP